MARSGGDDPISFWNNLQSTVRFALSYLLMDVDMLYYFSSINSQFYSQTHGLDTHNTRVHGC